DGLREVVRVDACVRNPKVFGRCREQSCSSGGIDHDSSSVVELDHRFGGNHASDFVPHQPVCFLDELLLSTLLPARHELVVSSDMYSQNGAVRKHCAWDHTTRLRKEFHVRSS